MSENYGSPKRLNLKAHPPATRKTYLELEDFADQAQDFLSGRTTIYPDTTLLIGGKPRQFLELATTMLDGAPAIRFRAKGRKHHYGSRWATPGGMLVMRGLLLYGGGCNVNDNGTGYSYVRMWGHVKQNVQLGRLLVDGRPGEYVQQRSASGRRANFRVNDSANFTPTNSVAFRNVARGRAITSPYAGRAEAAANALDYHRRHSAFTDIGISALKYQAFIERCFLILDALHDFAVGGPRPDAA